MARRRKPLPYGVASFDPRALGADCDHCPLKRCVPVGAGGPQGAKIVIVGEAPGNQEIEAGVPFVGASGKKLESLLARVNVARSGVRIDNAISCMPAGGNLKEYIRGAKRESKDDGVPFNDPVACCRLRLFRSIGIPWCRRCTKWQLGPENMRCVCEIPLWVKQMSGHLILEPPLVVVPVGNAALLSLLGFEGITAWRGSPIEVR